MAKNIGAMNYILRHIAGFSFGFTVFIILVPSGLYALSWVDHLIFNAGISGSQVTRFILSLPFILPGLIFAVWSNISLVSIGRGGPAEGFNIAISPRTCKLVINGPYRCCRNPMVFGVFMIYIGAGILFDSFLCLLVILVLFSLAVIYLRFSEEKRLIRDFGDEYIEYRKKVPMIFPFLPGRL